MITTTLAEILKAAIRTDDIDEQQKLIDEFREEVKTHKPKTLHLERRKVKAVRKIEDAKEEYVYDITMQNHEHPWFFANNILVHNSTYFSIWPIIKNDVESGKMVWGKEESIALYDHLADCINESYPEFMQKAFNCPYEMGSLIKCGREIVATKALFIKKKRYAALMFDKDGKRQDINGKVGAMKAMGLDLKRSDTPVVVQKFLSEILMDLLTGSSREQIVEKIRDFKILFANLHPWEKGTPKRVNNLTRYGEIAAKGGKATIPGHVRAALNWNTLLRIHNDNFTSKITDGMKTIVCKLKDNPTGFNSVGYPIDEHNIPQWFKDLPFDQDLMELTIVDQKVDNLLGVLNWDLPAATDTKTTFTTLFSFGD